MAIRAGQVVFTAGSTTGTESAGLILLLTVSSRPTSTPTFLPKTNQRSW